MLPLFGPVGKESCFAFTQSPAPLCKGGCRRSRLGDCCARRAACKWRNIATLVAGVAASPAPLGPEDQGERRCSPRPSGLPYPLPDQGDPWTPATQPDTKKFCTAGFADGSSTFLLLRRITGWRPKGRIENTFGDIRLGESVPQGKSQALAPLCKGGCRRSRLGD